ncbi:MAG: hypothetical protein HY548_07190, partial [Elusimicrobia bacterium]|nr:hypothetical protein [Elusimicrobiota bacterium]
VRAVREVVDRNGIRRVVVELPNGGALSARAIRAMALSTGMIIAVIELLGLAYEFYTPSETRLAATGRIKNVSKEEVIEAICGRYPDITSGPKCEMEHICDALATFEAAKNGNLVRMA